MVILDDYFEPKSMELDDEECTFSEYSVGKCQRMCPTSEEDLRVANKMVHRLETDESGRPRYLIKQFRRSAAGHNQSNPDDLRPPEVCLRTALYLMNDILAKRNFDLVAYHFIFDRLRSLRQDLSVQGHPDSEISAEILKICVRFHLISSYVFGTSQPDFDTVFNFNQLLECLKAFLRLHKERELLDSGETWQEAASIYLLLNLGSSHAISWALQLESRQQAQITKSLEMNWLFVERNFVAFFKRFAKLPLLPKLAAHWNFNHLWSSQLAVMNVGYSSKACRYPIRHFMKLTLLSTEEDALDLCRAHGIVVSMIGDENFIEFSKANPIREAKIPMISVKNIDLELAGMEFSTLIKS